jgi:hypothetical protein
MAGKSLIPFIGSSSNSTYNLTGEPTPANHLIPVEEYTMKGVNAVVVEMTTAYVERRGYSTVVGK